MWCWHTRKPLCPHLNNSITFSKKGLLATFHALCGFCLCHCFSPIVIIIAVRFLSLSLSRSSFVPSSLQLDVAGKRGWGVGGLRRGGILRIKAWKGEINEGKWPQTRAAFCAPQTLACVPTCAVIIRRERGKEVYAFADTATPHYYRTANRREMSVRCCLCIPDTNTSGVNVLSMPPVRRVWQRHAAVGQVLWSSSIDLHARHICTGTRSPLLTGFFKARAAGFHV